MKTKTNTPTNPRPAIYIGGNPLQPNPSDFLSYGATGDVLDKIVHSNGNETYSFLPHGNTEIQYLLPEEIHYI